MQAATAAVGAFQESVVFLSYFRDLPDYRQPGKITCSLNEILLLCLLAVLAGADTVVDIARFGVAKRDLLRRFLPYADGTPSHDQLGDFLAALDPQAFQRCFAAWVAAITGMPEGVIAIDGKTVRSSWRKKGKCDPIHIVSAFAARQRLVLAQTKVDDKSNEIIAIPKLLDLLAIEGAIVTIDAMGCQRAIAQKIVDKNAEYVLALKGNQGTLLSDVELFVAEQKANAFHDCKIDQNETVDGDHGRIEQRKTTVIYNVEWLRKMHDWPNLNCLVIVDSIRRLADKVETETRLYIASVILSAAELGLVVRAHWTIENGLHWVLDVTFREDDCRVRTEHAATNFATFRHAAHNLIRRAPGKDSMRLKRKTAAWNDDFLASLLAA